MKIGVLGTGFGMVHLQTFQNHPLVKEVVFFSRTQNKVDEVSAKLGLWGTTNMDDILCNPNVDVVTIALPHALHARTAIRAAEPVSLISILHSRCTIRVVVIDGSDFFFSRFL